jgi:uncharacterized protein YydD (DUF2326 family)
LSAFATAYYEDQGVAIAPMVKNEFGGVESFYPVFFGREDYLGGNEEIKRFVEMMRA